jgi:DNA-binding LacI/PurR family transcriptional regulator
LERSKAAWYDPPVVRRSAPTILDVAERAGVSKSLVSLVMRGSPNVSDDRRQAVLDAAGELGYRPNAAARSLARQRSYLIGVMVSDFGNPFFAELLEGVEEAAVLAEYRPLFNTGSRIPEREIIALDTLLQLRTDGVILASPRFDDSELSKIPRDVPVVMVGKDTAATGVDVVMNDDHRGSELVVDHLSSLGHRRIAHLHGVPGAGAAARLEGFVEAMDRRRLEPILIQAGFTEDAGAKAAQELLELDPLPTAVFAANDVAAMGITQTIEAAGLRIPDDVSLVGYDNVDFSGLGHIGLTTIDQPRRAIGMMAVEMLLQRLEGVRTRRRRVTIEPTLVVRTTTAPPPEGSS